MLIYIFATIFKSVADIDSVCRLGINVIQSELPIPDLDIDRFSKNISTALESQRKVVDPVSLTLKPWIDISRLQLTMKKRAIKRLISTTLSWHGGFYVYASIALFAILLKVLYFSRQITVQKRYK